MSLSRNSDITVLTEKKEYARILTATYHTVDTYEDENIKFLKQISKKLSEFRHISFIYSAFWEFVESKLFA